MIAFDVTKARAHTHRSGLTRVSEQLRAHLAPASGGGVIPVAWNSRRKSWAAPDGKPFVPGSGDWLLTPELFCERERPGITAWLGQHGARAAAIFHDAIPLRFPEITWPQSVARHPEYMRLLAGFGRVLAVSDASARELEQYWRSLALPAPAPVEAIALGADGPGRPRVSEARARLRTHQIVMIGIVEPRKNQAAVLDALEVLWREGSPGSIVFVGRVNPHFGRSSAKRMKTLARAGFRVTHRESASDAEVGELLASARFSVLPSRAEGCGLPVLESLWAGLPVLATALPSIEESARGGGCLLVPPDSPEALAGGLRRMLQDDALITRLETEACTRNLPRWADTAAAVVRALNVV